MSRDPKKEEPSLAPEVDAEIDFGAIDRLLEGVLGIAPDADGSSGTSGSRQPAQQGEGPHQVVAPESHPFGTLQVIATPDRSKAYLHLEVHDWSALDRKGILKIVKQRMPRCRIDRPMVERGLDEAFRKRQAQCRVEVATGSPPAKGPPAQVVYAFEPSAGKDIREVWTSFDPLPETLSPSGMQRLVELDPLVYLTMPGEVLAEKIPAEVGQPGEDIFGEVIPPKPGDDRELKAGKNVAASQDGLRLTAEISGYLRIHGDEVSVLSPVCISPNGQAAYFLNLRRANREVRIGREKVAALLEAAGVVHGIVDDRVRQIGEDGMRDGDRTVLVARGTELTPGMDARLDFAVDVEARSGTVLKDGSIDFRQRNTVANVKAGGLIVERTPPTRGQSGRSVTGEPVPAEDGEDRPLVPGQNVRIEAEEAGERLYAEINGRVVVQGNAIHVYPLLNIRGDVDYTVGNVDFSGDVNIGGAVRSGFSVKARGGVTVRRYVEGGASIRAEGPVTVCGGILGQDTRVVSGASVMAKFVHDARVEAAEEVVIGSYMFNASAVGREVKIMGCGAVKGGAVVGGVIYGTKRIETLSAGSEMTSNTTLVAGRDPRVEERLKQVRKGLASCNSNLLKVARALGIPDLTDRSIRQAVDRAPSGRRDFLHGWLKKLKGLTEAKENLLQERGRLQKAAEEVAKAAEIQVVQTAFPGTLIRIVEAERRLTEDVERGTFKRINDRIVW